MQSSIPGRTYVALSADHLVAVELRSEGFKRRLDDTTTETENKMESRFLRDNTVSTRVRFQSKAQSKFPAHLHTSQDFIL